MDLKALMQKLEIIDKKQNLMEAEKKETTWTDKSGKKHPATQVKGDKYTGKEAEKDSKSKKTDEGIVFNSAIAQELLREFNLEEAPIANPYTGADAEKFAAMSPADQAWLTKGGGKPDINDEFILARAPNKGKAVAKPAAAAPAPAASTDTAADRDDAEMGAAMTANAAAADAAKPAAPAAPAAVDPAVAATREKFKALMDKLAKTGGVTGAASAPAAAPAAKPPVSGKPAAAGFANTGGGAAVGNPNMAKQGVAGK